MIRLFLGSKSVGGKASYTALAQAFTESGFNAIHGGAHFPSIGRTWVLFRVICALANCDTGYGLF